MSTLKVSRFLLAKSIRSASTVSKLQQEHALEWNVAVKEAEKVVGYPTSFLNLRWLLNDEVANVALHLRKLVGTQHPLLKTAKDFFLKNETPAWGLVVLLVSRAGGLREEVAEIERDRTAGILHSQRVLAEVTEMLKTSIMIHNILMNVDPKMEHADDYFYGNKIALLSGDYLLSKSFRDLACLRNQTVNEIISSALRDLSEYEFLGQKDSENASLPSKPTHVQRTTSISAEDDVDFGPYNAAEILGNPKEEWILRGLLQGSSLLGKSCRAATILGRHEKNLQIQAYLFGKHLGLAWQAKQDYEDFTSKDNHKQINFIGAPVMLHLCKEPEFHEEFTKDKEYDFDLIREIVGSSGALEETKELQRTYTKRALKNLQSFQDNDARDALGKIINAL